MATAEAKHVRAGRRVANATADMVFTKFYAPMPDAKSE
jgi:hypothetical protein